jgi:hypothetical protein
MHSVLLRFVLLGTFVGGGVFLTVRDIATVGISSDPSALVMAFAGLFVGATLGWFLSLPFGLLPTCMAGLCYWYVLARHTKRNPSLTIRAALGGGIGLLLSTGFGMPFSFSTAPGAYPAQVNLISWACAGLIGGALSALLVRDSTYVGAFKDRGVTNEA